MIHSLTLFLFRSFLGNIKPILLFTDEPYISLSCARFIARFMQSICGCGVRGFGFALIGAILQ